MNKKLLIISIAVTIIYAIITFFTIIHHEVWADEAQVWQLCKYLSVEGLIKHLQNEGHPPLFYLMVMPFAKIFTDIIYMKLICWIFMVAAVFLLMYFAPFNMWLKIAIIFSSGFIYFLPVIARNYSIIPFLVFMAAILYSKSKQHPILYATIIALLANTHVIMYVFSICLGIIFYYENILLNIRNRNTEKIKSYIAALCIIILGFFCVFAELIHTPSSNVSFKINLTEIGFTAARTILMFFLSSTDYDLCWKIQYYVMGFAPTLNIPFIDIIVASIMAIIYVYCFVILYFNSKKWFLTAFLGIGFQFAIYIFAYNSLMYVNRVFCAHLILFFCLWMVFEQQNPNYINHKFFGKKITTIILTIFLSLTIYNGIYYVISEIKKEYAGGRKTAEFIQKNIDPKNSVLMIENEPYMVALVYYLNGSHELYSVFRKKNLRYVIWDNVTLSNFADAGWAGYAGYRKETDEHNRDYYVINVKADTKHVLEKTQKDSFELIYQSGETIEPLEGHRIYKYIGQ